MKSEHRHDLQTNELARHLATSIEQVKPYGKILALGGCALAGLLLAFYYFTSVSATRQSEAWNAFTMAVETPTPNMQLLKLSAEEYADSTMQAWANVTWADGQVRLAARAYLQNRSVSEEFSQRAADTYQAVLQTTHDVRLLDRARFGLARIYEMRNELDKAREHYLAVESGFALLAKQRAEQLEKKTTQEACGWLMTAEVPRRAPIGGPGTPGTRPNFSADDLQLPGVKADSKASIDDILERVNRATESKDDSERYSEEDESANE